MAPLREGVRVTEDCRIGHQRGDARVACRSWPVRPDLDDPLVPWSVTVGDKTFELEDLELEWFADIAEQDGRGGPFAMAISPTFDATRMWLIVAKCAAETDVEPPAKPERNSAREVKRLLDVFS